MRRYIGGGTAVSRGRKVIGWVSFAAAVLPTLVLQSPMLLSFSGGAVTITPPVWVTSVDAITYGTPYVNGVPVTLTGLTFPAAAGDTVEMTATATKSGYGPAVVSASLVIPPVMGFALTASDWTAAEAVSDANTRRTEAAVFTVTPPATKVWGVFRGSSDTGNLTQLGIMTDNGAGANPRYTWMSGGQAARNAMQYIFIAHCLPDGSGGEWASASKNFRASDVPLAPVGVAVTQGAGLGEININIPNAADGQRRGITGYEYNIDGGAWTALSGGAATGLRVITVAGTADVAVAVRATNANVDATHLGAATAAITVTPGVVVAGAAVTMRSSVTTMGATFTFAAPVAVVYDALGDPALVSTSAISITSITPLSVPVGPYTYTGSAGPVNTSGYSNGCWINAYNVGTGQGFDPILADDTANGQGSTENVYNPALNSDPAATGSAINFAVGQTGCLTKAVRRTDVALPGPWRTFDSFAVLPVLAIVPPAGFLLPASSDPDAIVEATEAQCRYDIYPNFAAIAGMYTKAVAEDRTLKIIPGWNFGGEQLRRMNLEDVGVVGTSNYAGDFGITRAGAKLNLLVADTDANKRTLHLRTIRNGLHHYANYKRGWRGGGGAGQHQGYLIDILVAAFALRRSDILEAFRQVKSNLTVQPLWVKPTDINKSASFPTQGAAGSDVMRRCAPYTVRHIGEPHWRIGSITINTYGTSEMNARYGPTSGPAMSMEMMVIAELQNGPGGINGLAAFCNGPFDNTNDRAASVHYVDKYISCMPNDYQDRQLPGFGRTWYAARRASWPMAPYAGRPTQFDLGDTASLVRITALAGGFSWNFTGVTYSVLPITQRNLRYGYDQRTWKYLNNVAETGSITGLLRGKKVYVQEQRLNAAGASEWSNNFAFSDARTERLFCTTTGTAANAAPVVDVAPRLVYKPASSYKGPIYEDCPAILTDNIVRVYVSDGLFTGYPNPTTTYEILVDGVVVSTADFYDFVPADLGGKPVTLRTTTTNGVGAPVVLTTDPVTTFNLVPDAADIVFQSDFGPDFKLRYPEVWASRVASASATIAHNGSEDFVLPELADGVEDTRPITTPGCLRAVKSGTYPTHRYNFAASRPLIPGATYRVTIHFPIGFGEGMTPANQTWAVDGTYWVGKITAPAVAADYIVPATPILRAGQPRIQIVTHTFTAAAGNTELWIRQQVSSASAGAAQGNPIISHVTVQRIG